MISDALKRIFCAALTAALLCPAALAESDGELFNPFTAPVATAQPVTSTDSAASTNPFGGDDLTVPSGFNNGGVTSADDLFAGDSTGTLNDGTAGAVTNDPFGTGTGSASATTSDPFGTGSASAATSDPFGTGTATPVTDNSGTGMATDPFAVSTAVPAATAIPSAGGTVADPLATANPFGSNVAPMATATPAPQATVSGYNPFASGEQPMVAVAPNTVMYVKDATLRIRAKAVNNGKVINTAYFGQQLTVLATQSDWAQVQTTTGVTGYCETSGLTPTDPNTLSKLMYAQLATTPVYKAPSLKTGRLRNLKKGDTVTMVAITTDGLWARVTLDGTNFGFTPSIYLDDTPAAEGTPVYCAAGNTAVMVNPEGWIQISSLSFGQNCWLVGYVNNNTIAKIRSAKGYVAYCDASALTTVDPANMDTLVYVQASGKVLSDSTGANAKYYNVNKNVQLKLLGIDSTGYWALVRQGKRKLYIPVIFVGTTRLGNNARTVVVTEDTSLFSSSQAGASVLGTLPAGTRLDLQGGDSVYARVSTVSDGFANPTTGYVALQYLRAE